jgi:hypothetical protein
LRVLTFGLVLTGACLAWVSYEVGRFPYGVSNVLTITTAAFVAAAVWRVGVRSHALLARPLGRATGAAVLSALAALAGVLVMLIPGHCPGTTGTGRCSSSEVATWGMVFGLSTALNLFVAAVTLAVCRWIWRVMRDGVCEVRETVPACRRWFSSPADRDSQGAEERTTPKTGVRAVTGRRAAGRSRT